MFLFEIGLLNGFIVDTNAEEKRNTEAKMVELDDDSVNVYFDEVEFALTDYRKQLIILFAVIR